MIKRKGVALSVDEGFFNTFEVARKKEQSKLRKEFGGMFNLTQRKFTALLDAKNFRFQIPTNIMRKPRRRRLKR